ncbi:S-layer homology domain-containing protein [Microbacterium aquimaris]|uniref:S-layer homology domain-containing protein n=1 Tax=Microbacterium aquimaris TaxID=459816 RepID=UPI002AD390B8|nr:S-layer homology domain-containing protein [Microbacterium aquimaris]MDZ8274549.1 S-layer homology domain-containing protein [Microbacterium aquimaris]
MRRLIAPMLAVLAMLAGLLVAPAASAAQTTAAGEVTTTLEIDAALNAEMAIGDSIQIADLSKFEAGNIISDEVFFDSSTMTEAEIQAFLEEMVPSCQSGYTCLKDWYDTSRTTSADAMCGAYSGGTRERASRIIYKVSQACGINPQVILATLQKEQGLVNHVWPSDWRYEIAMGQGCPDTAACDTRYYGFFNQVFGAAWQFKRYANPAGTSQYFTWYAPGKTWNILWNPNHSCGSSPVYIENQATANLYYYTPYQPNAAAIKAGYGTGDGCSSYGNRNFYQYFTDWFGSTQSQAPEATDTPFVDVATSREAGAYNVFAREITWLAEREISAGWAQEDGSRVFRPTQAVLRDAMAAFLYRLAGEPVFAPPATSPFSDVGTDHVFYKEISWLASTGLSIGWELPTGDWEFRPNATVTRDVMAAFLYRFAGEPSFTLPETSIFRDVAVDRSFYTEIAWLASTGISVGWSVNGESEFRPSAPVTRDVMAAFLYRLDRYMNPFADVSSAKTTQTFSVFAREIAWLADRGISVGWTSSDGARVFKPAQAVLRDAMAAFLYRLAGNPKYEAPAESPFVDVPTSHVFYKEIAWLNSTGVSIGWERSDGAWEFRPNASVTRDVMAAFLYRFAGEPQYEAASVSAFVDVPADRTFYAEISWLASAGITVGWQVADGAEFRPEAVVTRDVMAAFLYRLDSWLR